ncbi:hypothetical protein AAG747_12140 [Rapidithrix thailandica]|uniref:Uncharacterized protein n=1 Tax=Rapidithrix thailandica TaxID=413964 RepID=A0AAW9SCP4_9BACT
MKKGLLNVAVVIALFSLASCFGQHNKAPSKDVHKGSEWVYGQAGGPPRQLEITYPEDETGEVAEKIENIRHKLYPAK